ncbi:SDR family NAD(P)-dependent oxidoreductase [soil metagenome]
MNWNPRELPDQTGTTVVVTGAGRGVGYFVAEQLAGAGARVLLGVRSRERADAAMRSIRQQHPDALLEFVPLDLASLESVREAAVAFARFAPIDVLINNAGLTSPPRDRETTADGFELVVGTNHLGAFALTALLASSLAPDARVISLGSLSTRLATADLDDLLAEKGKYSASRAYATSKHAVHAFALELDRRWRAAGSGRASLLAHPGFALDAPSEKRPGITDLGSKADRFGERLLAPMTQGKDRGAWPVVRAAVDPHAEGGQFYGPRGSVIGKPALQKPVAQSAAPEFGRRLWTLSEELTGTTFDPA